MSTLEKSCIGAKWLPEGKLRICIGGGAGFIGSHMARFLKSQGHYVVCADWCPSQYWKVEEFCDEFMNIDLRTMENCLKASKDCDWVINLAADMGGMGFIQSNHSVIMFNNTSISINMLEAARQNKVKKFFFASSACVYPEHIQEKTDVPGLVESTAWPAAPQDAYGLEKLYAEEMAIHYGKEFEIQTYVARFHNVYGHRATWKGGREKAPAAFCRKVAAAEAKGDTIEMWGDGKQTRSFCFIDDCIEGILRLMNSDCHIPINLGSDEMISMNEMMQMIMDYEKKDITIKHIAGPEGVRGRNSDNKLIKEKLGWAPTITAKDGLNRLYTWIDAEIKRERAAGKVENYGVSKIVAQSTKSLDNIGGVLDKEDQKSFQ